MNAELLSCLLALAVAVQSPPGVAQAAVQDAVKPVLELGLSTYIVVYCLLVATAYLAFYLKWIAMPRRRAEEHHMELQTRALDELVAHEKAEAPVFQALMSGIEASNEVARAHLEIAREWRLTGARKDDVKT